MTIPIVIIFVLLVIALCACCYILGRIDQTLANLKTNLPFTHSRERGTK